MILSYPSLESDFWLSVTIVMCEVNPMNFNVTLLREKIIIVVIVSLISR